MTSVIFGVSLVLFSGKVAATVSEWAFDGTYCDNEPIGTREYLGTIPLPGGYTLPFSVPENGIIGGFQDWLYSSRVPWRSASVPQVEQLADGSWRVETAIPQSPALAEVFARTGNKKYYNLIGKDPDYVSTVLSHKPDEKWIKAHRRNIQQNLDIHCKKEWINEEGSIGENLMEGVHLALDGAGMIPLLGAVFDGINGVIYVAEGDELTAGMSFAAAIPASGHAVTAAKWSAMAGLGGAAAWTNYQPGGRFAQVSGGCFTAGTIVQTPDGPRRIEEIEIGDAIWSYNLASQKWQEDTVKDTYAKVYQGELVSLYLEDGTGEPIVATGNHPFWLEAGREYLARPPPGELPIAEQVVMKDGRWVAASELEVGDRVRLRGGKSGTVERLEREKVSGLTVHNLHVVGNRNYSVGNGGVLVHNASFKNLFHKGPSLYNAGYVSRVRNAPGTGGNYVYRLLRPDEDMAAGIVAKRPGFQYPKGANTHVLHGSRSWFKGDKWISTARDPAALLKHAQPGQQLVRIDLSHSANALDDVLDLTVQSVRDRVLRGVSANNFAKKSTEVLVEGVISPKAIQPVTFKQLGLTP